MVECKRAVRRKEAVAVAVLLPAGFVASANFNSGHAPHCWQSSTLARCIQPHICIVWAEQRPHMRPFVGALFVAGATGLGTRYNGGKRGRWNRCKKNCFRDWTFLMQHHLTACLFPCLIHMIWKRMTFFLESCAFLKNHWFGFRFFYGFLISGYYDEYSTQHYLI